MVDATAHIELKPGYEQVGINQEPVRVRRMTAGAWMIGLALQFVPLPPLTWGTLYLIHRGRQHTAWKISQYRSL